MLWIVTDDQRYDSIQEFNRILREKQNRIDSPEGKSAADAMLKEYLEIIESGRPTSPSRSDQAHDFKLQAGLYQLPEDVNARKVDR